MPNPELSLAEFPADDPQRARRFWAELLGIALKEREPAQGSRRGCGSLGRKALVRRLTKLIRSATEREPESAAESRRFPTGSDEWALENAGNVADERPDVATDVIAGAA